MSRKSGGGRSSAAVNGRPKVDIDEGKLAALYRRGLTLDELAEHFDCSRETVRVRLEKAGVKLRPKGTRPLVRRPSLEELNGNTRRKMERMLREGASQTEVAQAGGVTRHQVVRLQAQLEARGGAA